MTAQSTSTGPTSASVSRALFSSSSNALNESHLCFNKSHFNRKDFNVDRFVNLARRRANLSQIHNDLRVYLKIVQNSMIELINDDYADFVNLSSNLVGLKDTINKLSRDIESIWSEMCSSTREVIATAEYVEKEANQLTACRAAQIEIRSRIALIIAIERLADCLSSLPAKIDSFCLSRLSDAVVDMEIWYRKLMKPDGKLGEARNTCISRVQEMSEKWLVAEIKGDCRHVGAILGILTLIEGIDAAVGRVMTEVVDPKVEKRADNLGDLLDRIFERIRALRENWISKLERNGARVSTISPFIDKCLLTYIVSILDQRFGSVLVPSDNRLFHRCFMNTCLFISEWPDATHSRTVLRMIRDRFNLIVYFKLETQQFISDLNDRANPAELKLISSVKKEDDDQLYCECSQITVNALTSVWSDTVYLPPLIDKFWDFSLKILMKYLDWLNSVFKFFAVDERKIENMDTWRLLCAVCADCSAVDARAFELALSSIWGKIRELQLDVTLFGQCLSVLSSRLSKQRKDFENLISSEVIAALCKVMDGVSDIPRQYRWTKKPLPTESSPYIGEAFSVFDSFKKEAQARKWSAEEVEELSKKILQGALNAFCQKAEQVLDSVEQTGSSLQRFKRKGAGSGSDSNAVDSDEGKIRSQLLLDLSYCRAHASALELEASKLEALMTRATTVQDTIRSGPIHSMPNVNALVE